MSQICVAASMKSLDPNISQFLVLFGAPPVCKGLKYVDDTLELQKWSKKVFGFHLLFSIMNQETLY